MSVAGLRVRPMGAEDLDVRIRYFREAADEHLANMGVDRGKLTTLGTWRTSFLEELGRPLEQRTLDGLIWEADERTVGFSTADRIVFGEQAYLHLHVLRPEDRRRGMGTEFVRRSVQAYVERFALKRVYSEPHALNVPPNRTLQRAGFRYVSTQWTTPGPMNVEQVTNLWVFESPE